MKLNTEVFAAFLYRVLGTMPPDGEFCKTVKALADSDAEQDIQGYMKGAKEYGIFLEELKKVYGDEMDLDEADEKWMKEAGMS